MIIRTIIFYSSEITKNIAINVAKGLKGYVDVENYSLENKHIDMDPFHNVCYVVENKNEDLLNNLKKYDIYLPFKNIYILVYGKNDINLKSIEYTQIIKSDIKELVISSIKKINK